MNILGNLPMMQNPAAQMAMKMLGQLMPALNQDGPQGSGDPLSGLMSALMSNPSTSTLLSGLGGGGFLGGLITAANPAAALAVAALPQAMDVLGYGFGHLLKFFGPHHHGHAEPKKPEEPSFMDQAQSILGDDSLSVEEKLMRLSSLAADKIDDKVEKEMKEWSKEIDSTINKGDKKSKASKMNQSDRNHYFNMKQMEIQQLLQKKRELMSTVTQISKALFSLHQQIISNIR